jgi:hypothetical protein
MPLAFYLLDGWKVIAGAQQSFLRLPGGLPAYCRGAAIVRCRWHKGFRHLLPLGALPPPQINSAKGLTCFLPPQATVRRSEHTSPLAYPPSFGRITFAKASSSASGML